MNALSNLMFQVEGVAFLIAWGKSNIHWQIYIHLQIFSDMFFFEPSK